eukprot:919328_1
MKMLDMALSFTALLDKWAEPFVPLTALHLQELAQMMRKNLLLVTVGQNYPFKYHHFDYYENTECLVICHYHWGHFDRIIGVDGELSLDSIECFEKQYKDIHREKDSSRTHDDIDSEMDSDHIPRMKPPPYKEKKRGRRTHVITVDDADENEEEKVTTNTTNNRNTTMGQEPPFKKRKVSYTDGTNGLEPMRMVMNKLDNLQNGMAMMCDTLKEGFEIFGRKYREESRARSRSLSDHDSETPPKRKTSRRRRARSCGQKEKPSIPPRQWPVRLLAEHAYKVSKGQSEQSTAYYKMCGARSGGLNKYYKSVLVCL